MSIKEQILEDIKTAMREKESFKRDTLRLISSTFKQVEIDEKTTLDDERVLAILQTEIKKRDDSATQYKNAGREDLASKERDEIEIIKAYLPKQLSPEELESEIKAIINELNASSIKDLGAVMRAAREKIGAKSDGKSISSMAKKLLSE
ncbi:MAG: GatB/YqeY domain-containing protein [Campylobacteraceae bacterium]|nr:GatB/YqeY domain-containing protein [Campylobacteraceae bacterium]